MLLKNAKAVRVGSRSASAVSLGKTRVWPHRRIVGYKVVATFTARSASADHVVLDDAGKPLVAPYAKTDGLTLRAKGGTKSVPVDRIDMNAFGTIYTTESVAALGIKRKTVCELLAPVYGT